jgi:hypothetical protein
MTGQEGSMQDPNLTAENAGYTISGHAEAQLATSAGGRAIWLEIAEALRPITTSTEIITTTPPATTTMPNHPHVMDAEKPDTSDPIALRRPTHQRVRQRRQKGELS